MNYLDGITSVYASIEAAGFGDAGNYPIAWEVIALHNAAGRVFVQNVRAAFNRLHISAGYVLNLEAGREESIFCLECVFRDKAALAKVLNDCMANVVVYDEHKKNPVFRPTLLEEARSLPPTPAALAMPEVA